MAAADIAQFAKALLLALSTMAAADIAPSDSERSLRGSTDKPNRALAIKDPAKRAL
eukprot:CAMPEP_0171705600 /NCGR_PEP_ID=MMETSP0991-20121206/13285_1 /TAXON_ID=483369 /ORGANISM="non described non described, Strain CCMP2098" /LENGTH=55 /DNA_ID=CAMNT_0012295159 /DNA_START=487 /DNA_END=651 /DNA_ORIENTATION=-